jgi:hypothetical protein
MKIILALLLLVTPLIAGDVPIISNSSTPADGIEVLNLQEKWRDGGFDGDALFGIVTKVLMDDDGNTYLLDTQLSEVQVFNPDGEFIHTLSREGEGPGEVRMPVDMLFMPDNGLGLVQTFPGKIIQVDLEGSPLRSFTPGGNDPTAGGFIALTDAHFRGDNLVLGGTKIASDEGSQTRTFFVESYALTGEQLCTYESVENIYEFTNIEVIEADQYSSIWRRFAVGPNGKVYTAPKRNSYEIHVFNVDGTPDKIIAREFESWQRTADEYELVNKMMDLQTRNIPMEVKTEICTTEPDITSLFIDEDGYLWVLTARAIREAEEGIMQTYDIFSPEGKFVKQVAVKCPGDGIKDGLIRGNANNWILVRGFTDAILSLQTQGAMASEDEEPEPMEIIGFEVVK